MAEQSRKTERKGDEPDEKSDMLKPRRDETQGERETRFATLQLPAENEEQWQRELEKTRRDFGHHFNDEEQLQAFHALPLDLKGKHHLIQALQMEQAQAPGRQPRAVAFPMENGAKRHDGE